MNLGRNIASGAVGAALLMAAAGTTAVAAAPPADAGLPTGAPVALAATDPVVVTDPAFEQALRDATGIPSPAPLTEGDLAALTGTLDARGRGITDITGAQYLTGIDTLLLNENPVTSLDPLASLPSSAALANIQVAQTSLTSLAPLAGLENLETIAAAYAPLTDLSGLGEVPALTNLYVHNTPITDLAPLTGLPHLSSLDINHTGVGSLDPLADSPAMQFLLARDANISDVSALSGLDDLQVADLAGNHISDISPLGGKLMSLFDASNQTVDLPVASLGEPTGPQLVLSNGGGVVATNVDLTGSAVPGTYAPETGFTWSGLGAASGSWSTRAHGIPFSGVFSQEVVAVAPTITSPAPAAGVLGQAYTHTVTARGTAPITFALTAGALPTGLVLDPATGVISGTPTEAGTFTFQVTATNVAGSHAADYAVTVPATEDAAGPTDGASTGTTPTPGVDSAGKATAPGGDSAGKATAPAATRGSRLPVTGSDVGTVLALVVALTVGGTAAFLSARRITGRAADPRR